MELSHHLTKTLFSLCDNDRVGLVPGGFFVDHLVVGPPLMHPLKLLSHTGFDLFHHGLKLGFIADGKGAEFT